MPKLSVVIITFNEEKNIFRTLESVKPFADEIVVVDSMSTDQTVGICTDFGCKVYQREFDGYGAQKQFATDQASNNWVLSVDADEVVTKELQKEIIGLFTRPGQADFVPDNVAYRIPRSLHFMGCILKHGGAGKELILRLFDRTKGRFTKVAVHEEIEVQGPVGQLKGSLVHFSYRDISHHIEKTNTYTSLAAADYVKHGRSFSKIWVALKFPTSFFTFYILKGGFLDGYPGFMWSFQAAVYATLKIAKTIERTEKR
jgi:glycosyltransferase involved in cell wall biosynthesis